MAGGSDSKRLRSSSWTQQGSSDQGLSQQSSATPLFPIMKADHLIHTATSIGCTITYDIIQHPTQENVYPIYEWWLSAFMDLSKEYIYNSASSKLNRMMPNETESSLYRQGLTITLFHSSLNAIASVACIPDFSIADIVSPKSDRLLLILSGFINLYIFNVQQETLIAEALNNRLQTLDGQETDLLNSINELSKKHQDLSASANSQASRIAELQEKRSHLMNVVSEKLKQMHAIRDNILSLKTEERQLQSSLSKITNLIKSKEMEIAYEREQIISNPDKLRSTHDHMQSKIILDKKSLQTDEAAQRQSRMILVQIEDIVSQFRKLLQQLDSFIPLLQSYKTVLASLYQILNEKSSLLHTEQGLNKKLDYLVSLYARKRLEFQSYETSLRSTLTATRDLITQRDEELDQLTQATKENAQKIQDVHSQSLNLRQQIISYEATSQNQKRELNSLGKDMYVQIHSFLNQVSKKLNECSQVLEQYDVFLLQKQGLDSDLF